MIRRPPRSTLSSSSAASDVYKRQVEQQEVGVADEEREQAEPAAFAAGQHLHALLDLVGAELKAAQESARLLLVVADQWQHRLETGVGLGQLTALLRVVGDPGVVPQVGGAIGQAAQAGDRLHQ